MRPICVPCQRFFKPKKNDFYFTEGMEKVNGALCGNQAPEDWRPYKIWAGDLYECKGCGAQIVSGFGDAPLSEHYMDGFEHMMKNLKADQFQVNDC